MDQNWKTILLCLMLMLHYLKCTAYQNSEINYTVTGDFINLTCKYTGNGSVETVSWYNGTSDVPLTMLAESCNPVSLTKSSFDASRIQDYTCNSSSNNIYTLSIKLVPTTDYNETMACMFSDPYPGEPKANITVLEKGVSSDGVGGGGGWSQLAIVLTTVGILVVLIAAIAFPCYKNKCKGKSVSGKKKVSKSKYSYHVPKGKADQESSKPEIDEYEDLHKGEK